MTVGLYGKLHSDNTLTDIAIREQATYGDGSTDIVIVTAPTINSPYAYDSVNFLAIANIDNFAASGFVSGFRMAYASATTVTVGDLGVTSACVNSTYSAVITKIGQETVDMTTNGTIHGSDSFVGTGSCTAAASTTVTGTSTLFLTEFAPGGVPRVGKGTITTVGTACTGVNSSFIDGPNRIALGDLIGTAAKGYSQVTAIASNTACTLVAAIPGGDLTTSAWNVIENPTFYDNTNSTQTQVRTITSNTSMTITTARTFTDVGFRIGRGWTTVAATMPATNQYFMYLWVGFGSSGTGCFLSTQRTKPFGLSGYNTLVRRIGSVLINAGSIVEFVQYGDERERTYRYEIAVNTNSNRVLSAGAATAWTAVICAAAAPPTAGMLILAVTALTTAGNSVYVRKRNAGNTAVTRPARVICNSSAGSQVELEQPCDGAQAIDYVASVATPCTIDVAGWREYL